MATKRLNIMLYSNATGEQIILPVNPESIQIKYEKEIETYNILGFGQVNIMGNSKPVRINLSHFLPEDDSVFNTNANITYDSVDGSPYLEYEYSSDLVVEILKRWALEKIKVRLVLDEVVNMQGIIVSFSETVRESTASKPYAIDFLEYKNPIIAQTETTGLIKRSSSLKIPKTILMKTGDTVYSLADKYGLDFKTLAENNGIDDVNAEMPGVKLTTAGA